MFLSILRNSSSVSGSLRNALQVGRGGPSDPYRIRSTPMVRRRFTMRSTFDSHSCKNTRACPALSCYRERGGRFETCAAKRKWDLNPCFNHRYPLLRRKVNKPQEGTSALSREKSHGVFPWLLGGAFWTRVRRRGL